MKKKKSTKKIIIVVAIVLIIAIVGVVIVSCGNQTTTLPYEPIPVYTVYGVKGDTTTQEAVRKVELEINRVLTARYDFAVKLCLFNEDEYDDALHNAFIAMEMFNEGVDQYKTLDEATLKTMFDNSLTREQLEKIKAEVFDERVLDGDAFKEKFENGEYPTNAYNSIFRVMSEDEIVEALENNRDIYPDQPRVDIVLAPDYAFYKDLTSYELFPDSAENMLQSIASLYTSEARVLTQTIPERLRECAKIEDIPYGFPVNKPIGEYEYFVFDKNLLDKYGFDAQTMTDIGDIERFLTAVKENEPDVVPLMNTTAPKMFEFAYGDDTSAIVDSYGAIFNVFANPSFQSHFATVVKYRILGFLSEDTDENTRYAVRYFKGVLSDVVELEKTLQKQYNDPNYKIAWSETKKPIATTDDALGALFCFSKYISATDISKAVDFIVEINKDPTMKNTFLYGVREENYLLDADTNIVTRLNEDYIMHDMYTGNTFLAYTLDKNDKYLDYTLNKGDADYAKNAIKQNIDTRLSYTYGFVYEPGKIDGLETPAAAPDFISALQPAVSEYFKKYYNGSIIDFDYEKFLAEAEKKIRFDIGKEVETDFINAIEKEYTDSLVKKYREDAEYLNTFTESVQAVVDARAIAIIKQQLIDNSYNDKDKYEEIKKALVEKYSKEDATDAEKAILKDEAKLDEAIKAEIENGITEELLLEELEASKLLGTIDFEALFEEELTKALEKQALIELDAYRSDEQYAASVKAVVPEKEIDEVTGEAVAYIDDGLHAKFFETVNETYKITWTTQQKALFDNTIKSELANKYSKDIVCKLDAIVIAAAEEYAEIHCTEKNMTKQEMLDYIGIKYYDGVFKDVITADFYAQHGQPKSSANNN